MAGRGVPLDPRPTTPTPGDGQSDRVHDRRRPGTDRTVPVDHHDPPSPQSPRRRPRRRLHPALGDRDRPRRAQDPPAWPQGGAALEVTGTGDPGDLGAPVLPLRHPDPHVRRRRTRRPRSGPSVLRRRPAHLPPIDRPSGRLSPLRPPTPSTGCGTTPSANSSPGSSRTVVPAPTPGSSNASTSAGT